MRVHLLGITVAIKFLSELIRRLGTMVLGVRIMSRRSLSESLFVFKEIV